MSDRVSIKALREREVFRPHSGSVTRFAPYVDVPEDEWLALLDAVEALEAENERLKGALRTIRDEWEGQLGTGQMLTEFIKAALAGDAADTEETT